MLVTRQDLNNHGNEQDQQWFNRRLKGTDNYQLINGKLWVIYDTDSIIAQLEEYRDKPRRANLGRHNIKHKVENVLNSIEQLIISSNLNLIK